MSTELIIDVLNIIRLALALAMVGILAYAAFIIFSFRNLVPFVPTRRRIARRMIAEAGMKAGDRVIDLGSGTGNLVIEAARSRPDIQVTGVERSALLRAVCRCKLAAHPMLVRRVTVSARDLFTVDLREFDVVLMFLTTPALNRLTPHFAELRPGARVVSYLFHPDRMEGFTERVVTLAGAEHLYIYTKQ